jgi:hypothetical protein
MKTAYNASALFKLWCQYQRQHLRGKLALSTLNLCDDAVEVPIQGNYHAVAYAIYWTYLFMVIKKSGIVWDEMSLATRAAFGKMIAEHYGR